MWDRAWRLGMVIAVSLAASCSSRDSGTAEGESGGGKPVVCVVNYPLRYFAEGIGGGRVQVVFPAPTDGDPAFWKPKADEIAGFQKADLILLNGAGYAMWVRHVSLPTSKLVNTSAAFETKLIREESAVTHTHGPEGEHAHEDLAFTTWLNPTLAVLQARAIRDAFAAAWPDHAQAFEANFTSLERDLLDLDKQIRAVVSRQPRKPLVVSHPVYQYFTRRYGLNIKSVHWEPDEMPSDAMWVDLRKLLAAHPSKWMIWEGTPGDEVVQKLKALGVGSVVFSPCGNVPEDGDYLSVMQQNLEALEEVFPR